MTRSSAGSSESGPAYAPDWTSSHAVASPTAEPRISDKGSLGPYTAATSHQMTRLSPIMTPPGPASAMPSP
jgi:hypothetical protein